MTDKEYIDNFNRLSEMDKHNLKTMMYQIKKDKMIYIRWQDTDNEVDND